MRGVGGPDRPFQIRAEDKVRVWGISKTRGQGPLGTLDSKRNQGLGTLGEASGGYSPPPPHSRPCPRSYPYNLQARLETSALPPGTPAWPPAPWSFLGASGPSLATCPHPQGPLLGLTFFCPLPTGAGSPLKPPVLRPIIEPSALPPKPATFPKQARTWLKHDLGLLGPSPLLITTEEPQESRSSPYFIEGEYQMGKPTRTPFPATPHIREPWGSRAHPPEAYL